VDIEQFNPSRHPYGARVTVNYDGDYGGEFGISRDEKRGSWITNDFTAGIYYEWVSLGKPKRFMLANLVQGRFMKMMDILEDACSTSSV